jgi:flagellar hook-associated protein 2
MTGLSSLGIGSGIDLGGLVDALVRSQREPQDLQLNRRESRAKLELSALGTLRSAISSVVTAAGSLEGTRTPLRTTQSGPEVVTATLGNLADRATYQLSVTQLASAQSLASELFLDPDAALGNGVLTVTVGDTAVEIDLSEGAPSLRDVRDALNASDADVQAVIVRDGEGFRLLLTSRQSGAAGEMAFAVSGDLDTRLASAQLTQTAEARDAAFSVNGLPLTSSANTVEDVIPGVTLRLTGISPDTEATTLTIEPDRDAMASRVEALLTAYNALVDETRKLGRFNPETREGGPLLGNSVLRSLQGRLSGVLSGNVATELEDNPFASLFDLGVRTDANGKARLETGVFNDALASNEQAVEAVLSAFGESLAGSLGSFSGGDGIINGRTTALTAQIRRVTLQREALDRRMDQVETRLRAQFTALDSLVTQFQNTSAFLNQQLAGISDIRL